MTATANNQASRLTVQRIALARVLDDMRAAADHDLSRLDTATPEEAEGTAAAYQDELTRTERAMLAQLTALRIRADDDETALDVLNESRCGGPLDVMAVAEIRPENLPEEFAGRDDLTDLGAILLGHIGNLLEELHDAEKRLEELEAQDATA